MSGGQLDCKNLAQTSLGWRHSKSSLSTGNECVTIPKDPDPEPHLRSNAGAMPQSERVARYHLEPTCLRPGLTTEGVAGVFR